MLTDAGRDRWAAALSGFLLFSTAACSPPVTDAPMTDKPKPEYRENPKPVQAYRLTMRIADAPGPLKIMVSAAQHDVVNTECLPPPKDNPGGYTSPVPTNDIPFELTQVSDSEYTGVVYLDGMIDEDYHGHGTCRWELIQAQVQLKATGAEGETKFIASLSRDEFQPGQPKTIYYWNERYPQEEGFDDYPEFGRTSLKEVPGEKQHEFFSITLTIGEVTP